jgi:hypothetical protein
VKRVLLVCAEECAELEKKIGCSGCVVLKADDSFEAMSCARHQQLDAAILVSTGREMDVTETALNLGDINRSLEIIILADESSGLDSTIDSETASRATAAPRVLTAPELTTYLASPDWSTKRP